MDVQNYIFSVAFVVEESENKDIWAWFLVKLWDETVDMGREGSEDSIVTLLKWHYVQIQSNYDRPNGLEGEVFGAKVKGRR